MSFWFSGSLQMLRVKSLQDGAIGLVVLVGLFCGCQIARADDRGPFNSPEVTFGISSLADLQGLVSDLSKSPIGGEGALQAFLSSFNWTGPRPSDLRLDCPVYMSLADGRAYKALPVKDNTFTWSSWKADGVTVVDETRHIMSQRTWFLRRTPDYVLMSDSKTDLQIDPDFDRMVHLCGQNSPFVLGRDKAVLAGMMDFKLLRQSPEWDYLMSCARSNVHPAPNESNSDRRVREAEVQLCTDLITNKLGKVQFAVDDEASDIRLSLAASPIQLGAPGSCARPSFPANCAARFDFDYATRSQSQWLAPVIDWMANLSPPMGADQRRLYAWCRQLFQLLTDADTVSVAMRLDDGQPVIYMVDQFNDSPGYFIDSVENAMAETRTFSQNPDEVQFQIYQDGDKSIHRIKFTEGAQVWHLDLAQGDHRISMVFAEGEKHYVSDLLALPAADGQLTQLFEGTINPGSTLDVLSKLVPMAQGSTPMLQSLGNQTVRLRLNPEGDTLRFDLLLPHESAANLVQLSLNHH